MDRTDVDHENLTSSRHYVVVRRNDEVTAAPDTAPTSVSHVATDVARGAAWFGIINFYLVRSPGQFAVKVPCFLLVLTVVVRTLGLGALYPIVYIFKATWLMTRTAIDFLTADDGSFDVWFWAFALSLTWPIYRCLNSLIVGQPTESAPPHAGSHHSTGLSPNSSHHSFATSRTAQASGDGPNQPGRSQKSSDDLTCCGGFVYLGRDLDQPLTP